MAKKQEEVIDDQNQTQEEVPVQDVPTMPAPAAPVILRDTSRDGLAEVTVTFIGQHEGEHLIFGAVGRNRDNGEYVQRIDIINEE